MARLPENQTMNPSRYTTFLSALAGALRAIPFRKHLRVVMTLAVMLSMLLPTSALAQLPVDPPFPCPADRSGMTLPCPMPPWVEPPTSAQPIAVESYTVDALVDGPIATVTITEVLRNESRRVAEGVYLFPLPKDATASSLALEIDGEIVEGELYAAGEARSIYEEIVRTMRDPALLEWLDEGLFQISVFPIPAGATRTVQVTYEQPVRLENGLHNLTIPLKAYATGASAPRQIVVNVELEDQSGLRTLYSPSHDVAMERTGNDGATVGFEGSGAASPSDFSLYWGTDDQSIGINLISYKPAGEDGYLLLMLAPSLDAAEEEVVERDLVMVLDVSGSMQGDKIEQARAAVDYVIGQLNPGDRFNLITFSTGARLWQRTLQEATEENVEDARGWVEKIRATGSTDINRALLEAMAQLELGAREQDDADRPAYILFLTDGLPTQGETDAGQIVDNALDAAPEARSLRLFPFGVGYDVNTDLLDSLSRQLGGRSAYVKPDQAIDEIVGDFYAQIGKPVLANVAVDFGEKTIVDELYPMPLPDLFAGEQLLVAGRYREGGEQDLTLTGEVNGRQVTFLYPDQVLAEAGGEPAVARLWATRKMGVLLDQIRREGASEELVQAVVELSLAYGIVSPYTSWLVLEPGMEPSTFDVDAETLSGGMAGLAPANAAPAVNAYADANTMLRQTAEAAASGADAVVASEERAFLANATNAREEQSVRYVAGKTFVQRGWVEGAGGTAQPFWVDTAWDGETEPRLIAFGSEAYFDLLEGGDALGEWLAVSADLVIVLEDGEVVRVTTRV